jgi:hypothetical protein
MGAGRRCAGPEGFVPKGQNDNSPAFQRRGERMWIAQVPKGRLKIARVLLGLNQPSLRDVTFAALDPALKRRAILMMSLRDGRREQSPTFLTL